MRMLLIPAATGLDLFGARNYDPARPLPRPCPLFGAADPNQMGGYTYAVTTWRAAATRPERLPGLLTDPD